MDFVDDTAFPYPVNITRGDFADVENFDPDAFLFKNHRYTSLESLLADLTTLSKSLNHDLLDLVNNEYKNFIELGQSIGQCLDLINNISLDVSGFRGSLENTVQKFNESHAVADSALAHKHRLNLLKNKAKLLLLLHDQCVSFETLLGLDLADTDPKRLQAKLHTLATLYLSVTKVNSVLMEAIGDSDGPEGSKTKEDASSESSVYDICIFFDKSLKTKVISMRSEFKSYLNELLQVARSDTEKYRDVLLDVLQLYRISGNEADVIDSIKRS